MRILLITPDTEWATETALACDLDSSTRIIDDAEPDFVGVASLVESEQADLAIIGPDLESTHALALIESLSKRFGQLGLVYVCDEPGLQDARDGFRAGAADVVDSRTEPGQLIDLATGVVAQVRERSANAPAPAAPEQTTRVTTVVSTRGGAGRTLIAAGVASALERHSPGEVVLVDLDLQNGDLAALFGLTPERSIAAAASTPNATLDSAGLKTMLVNTDEGLALLAAPTTLTDAATITSEVASAVIETLAGSFGHIVIDTSAQFTDATVAALDMTTDLLLVAAPDATSVRAAGSALDALTELSIDGPKLHLVINKATERYGLTTRDIQAVTALTPIAEVPAAKEIALAINAGHKFGELVGPRSALLKALSPIVEELVPAQTPKGRDSFWARLR